ncbi:MAG: adenosylcobalamin-dependent ribonucleoside-diphosphate reductase [Bacillota bacterium]
MKVIKRSGKKVPFDETKIENAIKNAALAVGKDDLSFVEGVTYRVVEEVKENYTEPHVEEIQDIVEKVLIDEDYIDLARKYIRYRERHAQKRKEWIKDELPLSIWTRKYQFEGESFEEFFDRVSGTNDQIRKYVKAKKFLPAGRILANRGLREKGIKVTYSNCYVTTPPEDNLEDIIDAGKRIARTFSYGGGSGLDISKLRPRGATVNNAAKTTSGSVSFLDIYDVISRKIGQKGRRAALMISLSVDHPDIEEFIDKKLDLEAVNKANMSVRMKNDFMQAVENDEDYKLCFEVKDTGEVIEKEISSSKIFNKMAYSNWYSGEPGCLFWDRIKNWSLLGRDENFEFAGTNPCGEEPLPAGGSCLLGSLNLAEFVDKPFTDRASFQMDDFIAAVREGVVYLNQMLDEGLPFHPLEEQRESVRHWRQIGLGQMGLGSMLIKLGIRYGSQESLSLCDSIGFSMINTALQQSALLAKKEGPYPGFNREAVLASDFLAANATEETRKLIEKHGLRNSQLLTIAPTGSISNLLQVSGGIEPIFKVSHTRKTETLYEDETEYDIFDNTVAELMKNRNIESEDNLPDYVVDAHDLDYKERINMQSVWQQYIDASISSTINLSHETTVQEIKDLYLYAWKKGLKGVTVYRDGCAREGILRGKEELEGKTEMTDQDFIDAGVCPNCKANLDRETGCQVCNSCGFEVCD